MNHLLRMMNEKLKHMNPEKFKKLSRKPKLVPEVYICEVSYLSSKYKINVFPGNKVTQTALLVVGELAPHDSSNIVFKLRWDENGNSIDVDSCKNGKKIKTKVDGHHPKLIEKDPRIFLFDIRKSGEKIFKGKIGIRIVTENDTGKSLRYCIKNKKSIN